MQGTLPGGYVDFSRFAALRAEARSATSNAAALEQVADEFEALFVDLMLKAARDAEMDGGLFESSELDTYREMLDQQIAIAIARNQDLGIGRALSRQVGPAAGPVEAGRELHFDNQRRAPDRLEAPFGFPHDAAPVRRRGYERPADPRAFIDGIAPQAVRAAGRLGVSAQGLMSQAALETGWGEHVIRHPDGRSSFNFFGIKAGRDWDGEIVRVPTTEYVKGRAVTVNAAFRSYGNAAAAFDDYVELISGNPRYEQVRASGGDVTRFARELADAGYATDPRYAEKIVAIFDSGTQSGLWNAN